MPALVPLTFNKEDAADFASLAGLSVNSLVCIPMIAVLGEYPLYPSRAERTCYPASVILQTPARTYHD